MNTFTLHKDQHADFLREKRHDPITGDDFQAGDEVVFCKRCRSAFLRGSWAYMGETHCGQPETLDAFPIAQAQGVSFTKSQGKEGKHLFGEGETVAKFRDKMKVYAIFDALFSPEIFVFGLAFVLGGIMAILPSPSLAFSVFGFILFFLLIMWFYYTSNAAKKPELQLFERCCYIHEDTDFHTFENHNLSKVFVLLPRHQADEGKTLFLGFETQKGKYTEFEIQLRQWEGFLRQLKHWEQYVELQVRTEDPRSQRVVVGLYG